MQNESLYQRLKQLVKMTLMVLNNGTVSYVTTQCITISEGGGGSTSIDVVPSFWASVDDHKEEIRALPDHGWWRWPERCPCLLP